MQKYYSKFTSSTYNYTSAKASESKFLQKYFHNLKTYLSLRRLHNKNRQLADSYFFTTHIQKVLHHWKVFKRQQRHLRVSNAVLVRRREQRERFAVFSRWKRTHALLVGAYNSNRNGQRIGHQ